MSRSRSCFLCFMWSQNWPASSVACLPIYLKSQHNLLHQGGSCPCPKQTPIKFKLLPTLDRGVNCKHLHKLSIMWWFITRQWDNYYWLSRMKRQQALRHIPKIIQHKSPILWTLRIVFKVSLSLLLAQINQSSVELRKNELLRTTGGKRHLQTPKEMPPLSRKCPYSSTLLDSSATVSSFSSSSSSSSSLAFISSAIFISPLFQSLAA